MAAAFSVFTRIIGEDRASEVFRKVRESAKGLFGPLKSVNEALDRPSATALGRVGIAFDNVAGKARGSLSSISAWLPALGALGSVASLAGLISMTRKASDGYDGLSMAAEKLGASKSDLSLWRYGAKLANVESEALEKGLVKLNKTMYDAATGKNKDVATLFARMKIPLRDSRGEVKNVSNSLDDIAEAFKNTANPATRTAMAIALFGRAGADMVPFLSKGRAGIADLRVELKRYSGLTDEHRNSFERLDVAYKQLDKAGGGLASRLSAAVAPGLARVVEWTTSWIVKNRELIAQSLERKISAIGKAFDVVAKAGVALLAVPFVADLLKGADAGTAFDIALGGLGLTMAGPLFAALQMVTKSFWAMNVAMLSSPLFWIPAVLAASAYAVYANWGPITGWFGEQMSQISAAFDRGLGAGLWEGFLRLNPVNLIQKAISGLTKWLFGIDLYAAGMNLVQRLADGIAAKMSYFLSVWRPLGDVLNFTTGLASRTAGAAGLNADTAAAGGFNPDSPNMFGSFPSSPSPGSAAALANSGAPQKATIDATITVKTEPGTTATVESSSKGVNQLDVGRSMTAY